MGGRVRIPVPPERLRRGPLREGAFTKRLHDERTTALIGLALGIAFAILFITGLISHLIQKPPAWFLWPSRPVNLYRITQGLHVAAGIAAIPLLLAKLYAVYPKLFVWPPARDPAHLIERISLLPLVGGSLFMFVTGIWNVAGFEPWGFFFPVAHYWGAFITIGALIVHLAAKAPVIRRGLARRERDIAPAGSGLTRRGFLTSIAGASVALTVATIGQTIAPLRRIAILAPRDPRVGPQGIPVNKSAQAAGVTQSAIDPAWRLTVAGNVSRPLSLSLEQIRAMPSHEAVLPIACVQGWSSLARWRGVRVRDLLAAAGAPPDAEVLVESLQPAGQFRASTLNRLHASDPDTLLAYEVWSEPLHIDHGHPLRLIGPNRPGVMQTKWVSRLTVR